MRYGEACAALGIADGASQEEIKKAYKAQALLHHPDKGGSAGEFQRLAEAYDCLRRPEAGPEAAACGDDEEDGGFVDAEALFASVFTFNLHHRPSAVASFSGRVEVAAAEFRSALEAPTGERYVIVDARRPGERGASGPWPGAVGLSEGALDRVDVVELAVDDCVDDAGDVVFDARTGPTREALAMVPEAARAALRRVADLAAAGAHVVVLSQTGTATGAHKRTDCQRVAFFLRNSRMGIADPKRVKLGYFGWCQLAPPPPPGGAEDDDDDDGGGGGDDEKLASYRVISKGALVREAAALDSPLLADLPRGVVVTTVNEAVDIGGDPVLGDDGEPLLDAAGDAATTPRKRRLRVLSPVAGWMSLKQLMFVPPPRNPPDPARPGD